MGVEPTLDLRPNLISNQALRPLGHLSERAICLSPQAGRGRSTGLGGSEGSMAVAADAVMQRLAWSRAAERWRTPPGPEGSNGNRPTGCSGHYSVSLHGLFLAPEKSMAEVVYLIQDMLFSSKVRETAKPLGVTSRARDVAALAAAASAGAKLVSSTCACRSPWRPGRGWPPTPRPRDPLGGFHRPRAHRRHG